MPMYEYRCAKCKKTFDVLQKFSDAPLKKHEGCGGKVEKMLSAPAFQFKGSGWYVTDYGKGGVKPSSHAEGGDGKSESGSSATEAAAKEMKTGESKSSDTTGKSSDSSKAAESTSTKSESSESKSSDTKSGESKKSTSKSTETAAASSSKKK
jgi:putative FmdB family regulatory protein